MAKNSMNCPLTDTEMTGLMANLGPFENRPHIAVAVSGGMDSLCLTLLADAWVRGRGGKLSALSINHGLRPDSAQEAMQVGEWLAARGIGHWTLDWKGPKPRTGIQAAARAARYDLLGDWCRRHGVLHLLLAHHLEDQAETFLLRLKHDSGLDGLAAMAAIVEKPAMRLLRPLLGVAKGRLRATLEGLGQPWLEDPSNENTAFERVRIRKSFTELASEGMTPQGLAATAARMARARVALESQASRLLAQSCSLNPAGYARIDATALFSAADEISLRALSRTLMCLGGGVFPPRLQKLERLHEKMKAALKDGMEEWKGATLGRCRVLPLSSGTPLRQFLICRENRSLPAAFPIETAFETNWDNRFRLSLLPPKGPSYKPLSLQPLGPRGWGQLRTDAPDFTPTNVPPPVRPTLPALVGENGVIAVPHLNYRRPEPEMTGSMFFKAEFHPRQTLSGTGFIVAE